MKVDHCVTEKMATGYSEYEQKSTDRVPELLLDFAKVRYRKEMEKLAILPRSMESRELLEHHEMAVHLALEIVTETRPLTKEQKQHVKGILDTMLSSYEELNLKKKKAPGPAIGIDLGTTFSCVAVYRNEKEAEIVPSSAGRNKTPSYVAYPTNDEEDSDDEGDGEPYFGDAAKDEAPNNQKGTIYDVKRMLGRKFNDPRIQRDRKFWPFDILENNGEIEIKTPQGPASPLEVTTELLKHLKGLADNFVGNDVLSAVVAVPAYYSPQQRELIKTACNKAGLNVLQLVNEPIAAAVAYNFHKPPTEGQKIKHCLIFDFGGGTFDVAVLSIISNKIHVKTVSGDAHLGGQDIDNNMVDYCLDQFKLQHDVDLKAKQNSGNPEEQSRTVSSIRRLKKECEIQKCFLSQTGMQTISVAAMHGSTDLIVQMSKETFNSINNQIFQSCIEVMAKILEDSEIPKEDIDEVVMVGGSCRIPRIGELVSEFFGAKQLCRSIDADEAVAVGAAVLAFHAEHVDLPNVLVQEQEDIFDTDSGDRSTDMAKSTHKLHTNSMEPHVEHGQRTLAPFYLAPIHLEPLRGYPKTQGGLGYAIGIDLGLTYASIAIFNNSQVTILTNDCGRLKTPCFVIFIAPDEDYSITNPCIIVGNLAKEQSCTEPENTIYDAKLMMGRNYEDPMIQTHMKQWPFKIIDEDGACLIQIRDRSYRPEEVTAMLLRYLKEQAEGYLGGPVTHAVLTVPAHFKESQRTATKMAGEIAGLKILQILNEPTAAAIAYHQQVLQSCVVNKPKHLLIFDIGTKMFDLTLQTIDNGIVTTHAIDGDLHLGGNDFIDRTVQYCIQEFEKKHKVNFGSRHTLEATTRWEIFEARKRQTRLRNECEHRIQHFSSTERVTISVEVECFYNDIDLKVSLTIETFSSINQQLFDKITLTLGRLMTNIPELHITIEDVILIGGFAQFPKFKELFQSYFAGNVSFHRIKEAVAHGAAIYASQLTQ